MINYLLIKPKKIVQFSIVCNLNYWFPIKFNMGYKRFRHFGKDKITMDFAFFAIAFNIKKMAEKGQRQGIIPINEGKSVHLNGSHKPKILNQRNTY